MLRLLHRWPGLLAAVLVTLITLSGAALSVFPALDSLAAPPTAASLSVGALAEQVAARHPGVEQLRRSAAGLVTAWWFENGAPGSAVIDPDTGQDLAPTQTSAAYRWLRDLHRSLFLEDSGRLAVAAGAGLMLLLAIGGAFLVARRTGGWRRWFARLRGPLAGRLHTEIARVAVVGLVLSSLTGLAMSAQTFDLVQIAVTEPDGPGPVSGLTGLSPALMPALAELPLSELRSLTFPYPGDATEAFALTTTQGTGFVDQGTGALLAWADLGVGERISAMIEMLHTGQGAAWLGLLLGLAALSVPVLAATGLLTWLAGLRGRVRVRGNAPARSADSVIFVASEGGSSWGFAASLHRALSGQGARVHLAPMASFDPDRYPQACQIYLLAATYGDGDAPASARGVLGRIDALQAPPRARLAVLGFGDRSFPHFCGFARRIEAHLEAKGCDLLLPMGTVDRQSPQDFTRWGRALGAALGQPLELTHQPQTPRMEGLTLVSRRDYGAEVQAPMVILRFALPPGTLWQRLTGRGFARFQAGDLIGILPEGSPVPRFYSLASSRADGFIEIVVRKQPGGLCSGQLAALEPGEQIRAFLRPNPGFHAGRAKKGLILIGAGTGIGPLAGFLRANHRRRPARLYFGLRDPGSDFLYRPELSLWQQQGHLSRLVTAVSRGSRPEYVQDALRRDAAELGRAVMDGARIMVCGGRDMAAGVQAALTEILTPLDLSPALLKAEGRYVEDVY